MQIILYFIYRVKNRRYVRKHARGYRLRGMPDFLWSIIFTDSQSGSYFPLLVVRMDSKAAFSFLCLSFQALVHFVEFLHSPMK